MSTEPSFRTFVVAVADGGAVIELTADGVVLQHRRQRDDDGKGADKTECNHLQALAVGRSQHEREISVNGSGEREVDPGPSRIAEEQGE